MNAITSIFPIPEICETFQVERDVDANAYKKILAIWATQSFFLSFWATQTFSLSLTLQLHAGPTWQHWLKKKASAPAKPKIYSVIEMNSPALRGGLRGNAMRRVSCRAVASSAVMLEVRGLEAKIVSTGQQILNGVNLTIREVGQQQPNLHLHGKSSDGPYFTIIIFMITQSHRVRCMQSWERTALARAPSLKSSSATQTMK